MSTVMWKKRLVATGIFLIINFFCYADFVITVTTCAAYQDPPKWNPPRYNGSMFEEGTYTPGNHHPAEYENLTIAGEKPTNINEPDQATLKKIEEALQYLPVNDGLLKDAPKKVSNAMLQTVKNGEILIDDIQVTQKEAYSSVFGDPVRITTGAYIMADEKDISWNNGSVSVEISRDYVGGLDFEGSLGIGWSSSLDTIIFMGSTYEIELLYPFIKEVWNEVISVIGTTDELISENSLDLVSIKLEKDIAKLSSAKRNLESYSYSECQSMADEARNKIAVLSAFKTKVDSIILLNDTALSSQALIEDSYKSICEEIFFSRDNLKKNIIVDTGTEPNSCWQTGNKTLTYIDEKGNSFLYDILAEPVYDSTQQYPDGTKNRYPFGSDTKPRLQSSDTIHLDADGGYTVIGTGGIVKHYSYYGQLLSITGRNGEKVTYSYVDNAVKTITDDYGRTITIEYKNKKISMIRAPSGTVSYTYADGRLASVLDLDGDKVEYKYTDTGYLSEIIKSDQSSVRIRYGETNGEKLLVTSTVHEELLDNAIGETFTYDLKNKITTYVNHSGEKTVTWYDENNRSIQELLPDGTVKRYEYDNFTGKVSLEATYASIYSGSPVSIVSFLYEDKRNKTRATYSDGSYEVWNWNIFDEMTAYRDRDGVLSEWTYDDKGNLTGTYRLINGERTQTYWAVYDTFGKLHQDKKGSEAIWTYAWDERTGYLKNRTTKIDGKEILESWTFDVIGRILSYTDGEGRKTSYAYNAKTGKNLRNVVETTSEGLQKTYSYNDRKDLVSICEKDLITGISRMTSIEYDKRHLPKKITNGEGTVINYEYRADGKLINESRGEWSTVYEYDATSGELSSVTKRKASGSGTGTVEYTTNITSFSRSWDSNGNLVRTITTANPSLALTEVITVSRVYSYDAYNRVVSVRDPLSQLYSRVLTPSGRLAAEQTSFGGWIGYDYDEAGLLFGAGKIGSAPTTDASSLSINDPVTVVYNANGRVIHKTDRTGLVTHYEYNGLGLLKREYTAAGERNYEYDKAGCPIRMGIKTTTADSLGQPEIFTTWNYNDPNRTVSVCDGGLYTTLWTLDAWGNPVQKTDSKGNHLNWIYDGEGNLKTIIDQYGKQTNYEWNLIGKVSRIMYPDGSFEKYEYDHLGNLLIVTDNLGESWKGEYNRAGLLAHETGRPGIDKSYEYDRLGRLVSVKKGGLETERYSYENRGSSIAFTQGANGAEYEYKKNEYGELIAETNRLSDERSYVYDEEGRIKAVKDFSKKQKEIDYDDSNLVTKTSYENEESSSITRDYSGRIIKAKSATGTIFYEYDAGGKLVKQTDENAGETTIWSYDTDGQKIRMRSGNRDVHYDYGKAGELATVVDKLQRLSVSFTYDLMGREISRRYGNGVVQITERDEIGRATVIRELSSAGALLSAEAYLYDERGRRKFAINETGALTKYEYDSQSNLASVWYPYSEELSSSAKKEAEKAGLYFHASAGKAETISLTQAEYASLSILMNAMSPLRSRMLSVNSLSWKETYTYDNCGNRTTKTTPWGTISYSYDAENRLKKEGELSYTYDADGNLLSEKSLRKTAEYTYNGQNRMETSVITDLETNERAFTQYGYDAFGRRTLVQDLGSDTMRTLYDGLSFEVLRESVTFSDGSFSAQFTDEVLRRSDSFRQTGRYVWIEDARPYEPYGEYGTKEDVNQMNFARYKGERAPLYARGENVALMRSATECTRGGGAYFGKDILGSVRSATDEYGSLEDRYEYDAFGIPYSGDFSTGLGAGYTGKAYDPVTGLYNYGYRDYSPSIARFTTVDPIRDGANWFSYVNNDPVNWVDMWGLSASDSRPSVWDNYTGAGNPYAGIASAVNDDVLNFMFSTELRKLVGTPYALGGNSTEGTDCSGSIILALENMTCLTLPDHSAASMAAGNAPYITVSLIVSNSNQGNEGSINFYSWNSTDIQHVNAGVGQRESETTTQIVDATEGNWIEQRNSNINQTTTASAGTINQTYNPYQNTRPPTTQGTVNWDYIRTRLWDEN